jgi:hypothetical protein
MLLASWAAGLIVGFALLQWTAGLKMSGAQPSLADYLYFSATTFFTLAFAEPSNPPSRFLMVVEAALGYSFLGLVIGYPPLLYQHFSTREVRIALFDARAGTPPSATEIVIRQADASARLESELARWEEWEGEVLQSQLSYPMLAYFRSQHTNQSWLTMLTAIVDASALLMLISDAELQRQAGFTFAMGRHALVDLSMVFGTPPSHADADRLPADEFARLRHQIGDGATRLSETELKKLRSSYEPYAHALSQYFLSALPPWIPIDPPRDNWQATAWDRQTPRFSVSDPFRSGSSADFKNGNSREAPAR